MGCKFKELALVVRTKLRDLSDSRFFIYKGTIVSRSLRPEIDWNSRDCN